MRPDEHKRRKNTQYKKKHGITATDNNQGKKEKDSQAKSSNRGKSEGATKTEETKLPSRPQKAQEPKRADESDEEEKTFRRRNLVSNWSRYGDLPEDNDEDLPLQRGDDFTKLLASAGGSSAQFRFRDEEGWEETTEASSTTNSFLVMNLEDLQKSLTCLPLYQRLDIDKDLFSEDQLQDIETDATNNEDVRLQNNELDGGKSAIKLVNASHSDSVNTEKPNTGGVKSKDVMANTSHVITNLVDSCVTTKASLKDSISCAHKSNKSKSPLPIKTKTVDTNLTNSKNNAVESNNVISSIPNNLPKQTDVTTSLEDDLDMLLSLDESAHTKSSGYDKLPLTKGNAIHSAEQGASKSAAHKAPVTVDSKDDNLEDWLDSVLD